MILQILLIIGILASLFMFAGDMLLYFTTESYHSDGTFNPLIAIMKKTPDWRLMLGGLIGPIAAFLYCIGFYHIIYITLDNYQILSFITMLFCSLGIIISGAYHSHCAYLGLIAKSSEKKETMEKVIRYIKLLSNTSFIFLGLGLLLLGGLVLLNKTIYPSYLFLLTPLVLYFLKYVWKKMPSPFLIILFGGWDNLMFSIYFLFALLFTY